MKKLLRFEHFEFHCAYSFLIFQSRLRMLFKCTVINYERALNYIERGTISQKAKKISGYKCLVCEQLGLPPLGFLKENNQEHYIESHHVDPVSSGNEGSLSLTNIITLCANHHRQMHYGNVVLVEDNEYSFVFSIDDKIVRIKKIKI